MRSVQEQLAFDITMNMMKNRGYDIEDPINVREFDASIPDSQFSIVYEDVEYILDYLYREVEETDSDIVAAPMSKGLTMSNISYFDLGQEPTVGDVRTLVSYLNDLQIPDDHPVDGRMTVSVLHENTWMSSITCGDCGMDDILVMTEEHANSGCGSDEEIESVSVQAPQTQPSYAPSWTGYSANLPDPNSEIVISTDNEQLKLY